MELVVVNDGEPIQSLHSVVRVVNVGRGLSIGRKRNIGARQALGSLVATWDDDDFSLPERTSTQVREMGAAGSWYHRFRSMWVAIEDLTVVGLLGDHAGYPTALVDRMKMLEVGGCPDLSYLEDMELYTRFAMRGFPKTVTDLGVDTPYVHRRHGSNVSSAHGQDRQLELADRSDQGAADRVNGRLRTLMAVPVDTTLFCAA